MSTRGPERKGIEHVEDSERHGRPFSIFILWFASNLTIADYALGSVLYGLPLPWIYAIIVAANLAAGAILGLTSAMGPKFGLPQMAISGKVFGWNPNRAFAALAWITMIGWFSVNVIISTFALQELVSIPYWAGALIAVAVMAIVGFYGHDVVHYLERAMSIVLGVLFAILVYVAVHTILYPPPTSAPAAYVPSFNPYLAAIAFVSVFSYLASWAPYASDYTRYLPSRIGTKRLMAYTMMGGIIASVWLELLGTLTYVAVGNPNLSITAATVDLVGRAWGPLVMSAIFLGGLSANALNIYSSSISAQVIYAKFRRMYAAIVGALVGYILSLIGGIFTTFSTFYSTFLEFLAYWITPWVGVLLASVYLSRNRNVRALDAILSYVIGLLTSVPFMNLKIYGVEYVGPVAAALSGADLSYFISFAAAIAATLALNRIDHA